MVWYPMLGVAAGVGQWTTGVTIYARAGEWVTCAGRPLEVHPLDDRGMVEITRAGRSATVIRHHVMTGEQHDIAQFGRDINAGEILAVDALVNWQAPLKWGEPFTPVCPQCGAKWFDPKTGSYHVELGWRDRPIGYVPVRKEFATLAEMVRQEAQLRCEALDPAELARAERMDADILQRSGPPPTWWQRLVASCARIAQRAWSALTWNHP